MDGGLERGGVLEGTVDGSVDFPMDSSMLKVAVNGYVDFPADSGVLDGTADSGGLE